MNFLRVSGCSILAPSKDTDQLFLSFQKKSRHLNHCFEYLEKMPYKVKICRKDNQSRKLYHGDFVFEKITKLYK
jgi:hypothetical protein